MKKQSIILTLMLVLSLSVATFAGETHGTGGETHGTGVTGIICEIVDCIYYLLN